MSLKIYRRGEIWYYRGTVNGQRLRGSTETTEKGRAKRIAAEVEAKYWKYRLDGPEAVLTFANAAHLYRDAEKSTRFLDRVEDHWKETLVSKITAGDIRQAAITLYPNAKASTRNRQAIVPAQAIINHAAGMELCKFIHVPRFKVEKTIKQPVTLEWVNAFTEHASPHLAALCLFMFGTGARISEATGLRWGDVDLSTSTALIRQTKQSSERIAHLQNRLIVALANIPSRRRPQDQVFKYQSRSGPTGAWETCIENAKIKPLSFHSCRHGFATTLLHSGVDVATVAKMGGWDDVSQVNKTYGHAQQDTTITDAIFDPQLTQETTETTVSPEKQKRK